MQMTIKLNDDLLAEARSVTGLVEGETILNEALKALIERESARRLIGLGGTEPDLRAIPRR